MANDIVTCHSFPDLVEELKAAKKSGARLTSTAPDPQLGQAVGFKLSDGRTLRLPLAKVTQFDQVASSYPELQPLHGLLASIDGRIKLFMTC